MNQLTPMRRGCTRIGVGMTVYMVCTLVLGVVYQVVISLISPTLGYNTNLMMLANDLITYGISPLLLWLILRPLPVAVPRERGLTPRRMGKLVLEAIGLMYSVNLLTSLLISFISILSGRDMGNLLDNATAGLSLGAMFIYMVIVAPICEELIFRRMVFRRLLPMGENFAIVMSALLFALFHSNLFQVFYAFVLGVLFGCVVVKTGRIRYTIGLHMLLNLLGSVVIFALEPYELATTLYTVLIYVLTALGLVVFFRDFRNLFRNRPSLPGCWQAAFTSWGMLLFIILFTITSVGITFIV